jgi:uncharacterized protein with PQ loop repeat
MSSYALWGTISSVFFLSAVPAIAHQLRVIWKRKRLRQEGALSDPVTQSISLNQIVSSYFAIFSFFLFGIVLQNPDPFLTYPRAIVGLLLYWVVLEIHLDRRTRSSTIAITLMSASLLIPFVLFATGMRASSSAQGLSNILVCAAAVLMAQGAWSQFIALRTSKKRGAVSLPMHLVLYGKDFSGLMFGCQIGWTAWSIVLMHAVNLITRAPIIYTYVRSSR